MRDYYGELDRAIKRYENYSYPIMRIQDITNRIDWCWKFKHITREQMESLADRTATIMQNSIYMENY